MIKMIMYCRLKRLKLFLQFEECTCKRQRVLQRYYKGKK